MNISIKITGTCRLLATILLVSIGVSAKAHEYVPMIRYDRVWECYTSYDFNEYEVKYLKFDGVEDFEGKSYHRIVTAQKSFMKKSYDGSPEIYEFDDDSYELEGYLREENGKVYTLAVGDNIQGEFCGTTYPSDSYDLPDCGLHEVLLYDFTADEGDSITAFSNLCRQGVFTDFRIDSKSTVIVDGEECCHMDLSPASFDLVEGIGPVSYGCLNYNEYDIPAMMWAYNYFNRLFDSEGNVLFESSNMHDFKLPDNIFSSVESIYESERFTFSSHSIHFGMDHHKSALHIYDMTGSIVKSKSSEGKISISTDDLQPGIYIATGFTNDIQTVCRKFTVN